MHICLSSGPEGLQFDEQGMVLPHSILGSLDDFRSFLEARGEAEVNSGVFCKHYSKAIAALVTSGFFAPPLTIQLIKRIPKSQRDPPSEVPGRPHSEAVESGIPSIHRNVQRNALQHWRTHMRQRRRQQDLLSGELIRE